MGLGRICANNDLVSVLLINAVAILSEDRFLARGMLSLLNRFSTPLNTFKHWKDECNADQIFRNIVGWSNSVSEPAFGSGIGGDASIKSKLINLMTSVRTLMRSTYSYFHSSYPKLACILAFGAGHV